MGVSASHDRERDRYDGALSMSIASLLYLLLSFAWGLALYGAILALALGCLVTVALPFLVWDWRQGHAQRSDLVLAALLWLGCVGYCALILLVMLLTQQHVGGLGGRVLT